MEVSTLVILSLVLSKTEEDPYTWDFPLLSCFDGPVGNSVRSRENLLSRQDSLIPVPFQTLLVTIR